MVISFIIIAFSGSVLAEDKTPLDISSARIFYDEKNDSTEMSGVLINGISYSGDIALYNDGTWDAKNVAALHPSDERIDDEYRTNLIINTTAPVALTPIGDGVYRFTVQVKKEILSFTEPPGRKAEFVPIEILDAWNDMFDENPNTVVMYTDENGVGQEVVIEMIAPNFNSDYTVMEFEGRLLNKDNDFSSLSLESVTLLVDPTVWKWISVGLACGGTVVAAVLAAGGGIAAIVAAVASAGTLSAPAAIVEVALISGTVVMTGYCATAFASL